MKLSLRIGSAASYLSILTLFLGAMLCACGDPTSDNDQPAAGRQAADSEKADVVGFFGTDEITRRYIGRLLESRRIPWEEVGGFVRTASVFRRDLDAARKLLAGEEGLGGFLIWSTEDLSKSEAPYEGADIDLTYPQALSMHGPLTVVGRILRSPEFPSPVKLADVERITRVEWRVRRYVTSRLEATKAIQGRVLYLRTFPGKSTKLFKGISDVAVFEPE